jgi:hypothetical protein
MGRESQEDPDRLTGSVPEDALGPTRRHPERFDTRQRPAGIARRIARYYHTSICRRFH